MKIAYVAVEKVGGNHGVPKKFAYQLAAWRAAGAECEFFAAAEDADSSDLLVDGKIFLRKRQKGTLAQWREDRRVLAELVDALKEWDPDVVYLRWGYHKPEYVELARLYPTIIELNGDVVATAELSAKEKVGLSRILGYYVRFTVPRLFCHAAGFVAVTYEVGRLSYVKRYGKPIGVFPNSIDLGEYSNPIFLGDESELPRIVFIGNVASWHGLDKVLAFAKKTLGRLEFDVIGCNSPKNFVSTNVKFHGYLDREEYLSVFSKATLGLDGVALYRKNMNEACPLKIREYLAAGLPVILSAEDTAFVGSEKDWILRIGNRSSNLTDSLESIVEFSERMKGKRVPHSETLEYISTDRIEGEKVKFFQNILNEC